MKFVVTRIIFILKRFFLCSRQYVVDYKCTNDIDSSWFIRDASKSFPSGHSSTSFYEAVFVIWLVFWNKSHEFILFMLNNIFVSFKPRYLQMRSPRIRSRLLIPTIQCVFLLFACLCSLSRITDHRHHWWDVLAGAKIGILFASLTVGNSQLKNAQKFILIFFFFQFCSFKTAVYFPLQKFPNEKSE